LCGYNYKGWTIGQRNTLSTRIEIGGQLHTRSNAPQYDHTLGSYPGKDHIKAALI